MSNFCGVIVFRKTTLSSGELLPATNDFLIWFDRSPTRPLTRLGSPSMSKTISHLIINSPYEEPALHWHYDRETRTFSTAEGRRPAGYVRATAESKAFDDPGVFVELPLVNQIRPRIKEWRRAGFPGVSGITRRLLEHWHDPTEREGRRFFFCQLEAAETMIWLTEASAAERQGIDIPVGFSMITRVAPPSKGIRGRKTAM